MNIFRFLLNILFPPHCVFCDRTMEPNAEVCICGSCPERVTLCSASPCCEKCGKPLISYGDKRLCYFCLNTKSKHFDKIVSVFTYDNLVQESIRRYKINGIASYAPTYAVCMQGRFFEEYGDTDFDFMCGTPSHTDKLKNGGFDQTDELCRRLSPLIGVPYRSRLLYKTRETEKQSTLGVAARRTNLTDSVAVAEGENVEGATALLIDGCMYNALDNYRMFKGVEGGGSETRICAHACDNREKGGKRK